MKETNRKHLRIGLALAEILLLIICLYRLIFSNEFSQNFVYDSLESEEGLYLDSFEGEGGCYVDNSMESRENCIRTMPIILDKGSYKINIQYKTETYDQSYSFMSENATYRVISGRQRSALPPDQKILTLNVNYGKTVNGFQIQFNYSGNGYLVINNVDIIRTKDREKTQLFVAFFLVIIIEFIWWWNKKEIWKHFSIEQKRVIILGCVVLILSSYPIFSPYLYEGHDLNFHLMRIEGVKDGLLAGEFPVRIQPTWLRGNGYAASIFYGDLFLYYPAILRLMGFSVIFSYYAYVLMINVLTFVITYFCAKGYSKSRYIGFLGATVYTLAPYRLTCIFVRAAVGEYTAMAFIPLIFYGLYCIAYNEPEDDKEKKSWVFLVCGFSGVIQSHIITCEIVGVLFAIMCLMLWRKLIKKLRLFALVRGAIWSVIVNASFLVPFINYMIIGGINVTEENSYPYIQTEGILGSQLFSIFPHAYGETYGIVEGMNINEMSLCIGLPFMIGILLSLLYYIKGKKEDKQEYKRNITILLMSGILIFMSTVYFPWDWLVEQGKLMVFMVKNIQFPWRLLGIISFLLSFVVCSIVVMIYKANFTTGKQVILLIGAASIIVGGYFMSSLVTYNNTLVIKDESQIDDYGVMGAEYLPTAVSMSLLTTDGLSHSEGIKVNSYLKRGITVQLNLINNSNESQNISVPLIYYFGYNAKDLSTKKSLEIISGENGNVTCVIPGLYSGVVEIGFKAPIYWRAAEISSLIGCLWLIFSWFKRKSNGIYSEASII